MRNQGNKTTIAGIILCITLKYVFPVDFLCDMRLLQRGGRRIYIENLPSTSLLVNKQTSIRPYFPPGTRTHATSPITAPQSTKRVNLWYYFNPSNFTDVYRTQQAEIISSYGFFPRLRFLISLHGRFARESINLIFIRRRRRRPMADGQGWSVDGTWRYI